MGSIGEDSELPFPQQTLLAPQPTAMSPPSSRTSTSSNDAHFLNFSLSRPAHSIALQAYLLSPYIQLTNILIPPLSLCIHNLVPKASLGAAPIQCHHH